MTGRVVCAAVIAGIIAVICSACTLFADRFSMDITNRTKEIYGKGEDCAEEIEELKGIWEEYSDIAAFYIEHEELEKVTVLIERLNETNTESEHMFRMDCREIELIMEHLGESQQPKFNNIF